MDMQDAMSQREMRLAEEERAAGQAIEDFQALVLRFHTVNLITEQTFAQVQSAAIALAERIPALLTREAR